MKAQPSGQSVRATAPNAAEIDVHVGLRIRERREEIGVTQNRLARRLGVTFSQVQKYEKGSNRIGAGRLYLAAEYLGVPVGYFFERLAADPATNQPPAGSVASGAELAMLQEAFLSISDAETRNSVLALVRSIVASAELAGKSRRIVA